MYITIGETIYTVVSLTCFEPEKRTLTNTQLLDKVVYDARKAIKIVLRHTFNKIKNNLIEILLNLGNYV